MLDIVITHYDEPWEVCKRLFQTLDAQRGVDWSEIRVSIVNDGDLFIDAWHLFDMNYEVHQYSIEHKGVSAARNKGIELTWRPWIMFCDCDDCFSNVYALADIMSVIKSPDAERYDMMWTKVWQEKPDGQVCEIPDKRIMVFIHGKIYRRAFLEHEEIRFDESMTFNEDSLFNATIMSRIPNTRIGAITTAFPGYVWINREGSVTSADGWQDKHALGQFSRNLKIAAEIKEHKPEEYSGMVTRVIYDTYFMAKSGRYTDGCKAQILEQFLEWVKDKRQLLGMVEPKTFHSIKDISRRELTEPGEDIQDDYCTVRSWMEDVLEGKA